MSAARSALDQLAPDVASDPHWAHCEDAAHLAQLNKIYGLTEATYALLGQEFDHRERARRTELEPIYWAVARKLDLDALAAAEHPKRGAA